MALGGPEEVNGTNDEDNASNNESSSSDKDKPVWENREIVARLLSYLPAYDFLNCRLISKLWNEEAERTYPKKRGLIFNAGTYLREDNGAALLPKHSPLPQRQSFDSSFPASPREFFLYLRHLENVQALHLEIEEDDEGFTTSLLSAFEKQFFPNLTELYLEVSLFVAEVEFDKDFSLPNLKVLDLSDFNPSENEEFFSPFIQAIVDKSPNLVELGIHGGVFPHFGRSSKIKRLLVEFVVTTDLITELEAMLLQLSSTLKELSLGSQAAYDNANEDFQITLPIMPVLKTFSCDDLQINPFPFGRCDLILFLNERMPVLEDLKIQAYSWSFFNGNDYDTFVTALDRSGARHERLKTLSIPMPQDVQLLPGLKEKFPLLKELNIAANVDHYFWNVVVRTNGERTSGAGVKVDVDVDSDLERDLLMEHESEVRRGFLNSLVEEDSFERNSIVNRDSSVIPILPANSVVDDMDSVTERGSDVDRNPVDGDGRLVEWTSFTDSVSFASRGSSFLVPERTPLVESGSTFATARESVMEGGSGSLVLANLEESEVNVDEETEIENTGLLSVDKIVELAAVLASSEISSATITTLDELDCSGVTTKFYGKMTDFKGAFKVVPNVEEFSQKIIIIPARTIP